MDVGVSRWVLGSLTGFWGWQGIFGVSLFGFVALAVNLGSPVGFWGLPMNIGVSQLGFGIS